MEDEVAYLLERVRGGDLAPEKLELAAYCGHEGAVAALPIAARGAPEYLVRAVALEGRFGREVRLRARTATLRALLPVWSARLPDDDRPRSVVAAADAYLGNPTDEALQGQLRDACEAAEEAGPLLGASAIVRTYQCGEALTRSSGADEADLEEIAWIASRLDSAWPHDDDYEFEDHERSAAGVAALARSVREELMAWSLGPVRQ